MKPLPRSFYRGDVLDVAQAMVGKLIVHVTAEGTCAGRIVETEAYRGPEDAAAHSYGGRRTERTETMWGPPGHAYMFLIYGMHWCFNVVVAEAGLPHAVLVRAIEPVLGHAVMASRRGMKQGRREVCNGPGKLSAALGLNGDHKGVDLTGDTLFLSDAPAPIERALGASARINIDYAGDWVDKPWRWYERGNRYVSVKPRD